ncbi:MAG: hypothetical protein H6R01_1388 [Burkholderiaceae bacterium]|nr:hypothetical protein [Burkholderiaceae bacterium]
MNDAKSATAFSLHLGNCIKRLFVTPVAIAGLVLLVGLSATGGTWWKAKLDSRLMLQKDFDSLAANVATRINLRMRGYQHVLRSVQGLYGASSHVTLREFRRFVEAQNIQQSYPGIQDIAFVQIVPEAGKKRHVALMRRQGFHDYRIWPEGISTEYAVLTLQATADPGHRRVLGYDMFTDTERRAAMERARDTGDIAFTGPLFLLHISPSASKEGVQVYMPVYRNGLPTRTVAERRQNIIGWVCAPLRMRALMSTPELPFAHELAFRIYDGNSAKDMALMHDSAPEQDELRAASFRSEHSVQVADRSWLLEARSLPAFEGKVEQNQGYWTIAGVGIVLSILLSMLTWLLASGRARAISLASKLTRNLRESETRFRLMADAAPAMIWTGDSERQLLWVNRAACEFVGADSIEAFRRAWKNGIFPADRMEYEALRKASQQQRAPFRTEYRARRRDGQYRWILSTGVPRFNENGEFAGFIGCALDITERKDTELALQQAALVYRNSSEAMIVAEVNLVTRDLFITDINDAVTKATGYLLEDVVGKDTEIFSGLDYDEAFYDSILQELIAQGQWQGEFWIARKDGSRYLSWLCLNAMLDEGGQVCKMVALSHDLTKLKEAEEMIRSLSASLINAREDEARRIAHDIHDDLGQQLSLLRLNLSLLPDKMAESPLAYEGMVEWLKGAADACMMKVRNIASGLRPATLDMGLGLAIKSLTDEFSRTSGISCVLSNDLDLARQVDDTLATNIYRILQEALSNVVQHANASRVVVMLLERNDNLCLQVSDDGDGFDSVAPQVRRSLGLVGMRERAAMLGGEVQIISTPGQGTNVRASFPLRK